MTTNSTSFSKDSQPKNRRGKSERTKILESFKRLSKTEDEFYDLLTAKAFTPDDQFSFKELLSRISPVPKSTMPLYEFDFDENGTPLEKSSQVLKAMSIGRIPADVGGILINSIASMIKIQEVTDIDERLKIMENQREQNTKA